MTCFSYEVPLAHLEDFDPYQDLYFALSFLCDDPHYVDFIKNRSRGRLIILDNSFNELGVPSTPNKMARLFNELNADMVVSPDCDSWSLEQLRESYKEMISLVPKEKVLVVIKSKEERDMFLDEGVFYYCTTYEQRAGLPLHLLTLCYHFLGLLNPWEIKRYNPISCDTSQPLKLALQGKTMEDWVKEGCPHIKTTPAFFDLTFTKEELELAKRNCEWIKNNLAMNAL